MIKIFKCEKCGMAFDNEKDCIEHEQNCNKGLEEKIINLIGNYGIDVQHVSVSKQENGTYKVKIKSNIPSGYKINFDFESMGDETLDAEEINHQLRKVMGETFGGRLCDMKVLYDGWETFGISDIIGNNIDLSLIAKVYEGHHVKIKIID